MQMTKSIASHTKHLNYKPEVKQRSTSKTKSKPVKALKQATLRNLSKLSLQ
jgi:hypothetical protein